MAEMIGLEAPDVEPAHVFFVSDTAFSKHLRNDACEMNFANPGAPKDCQGRLCRLFAYDLLADQLDGALFVGADGRADHDLRNAGLEKLIHPGAAVLRCA